VLPPARPPFFFASDGLGGLGCEGNGWISRRRRRLGSFRFRVVCPADGRKVEASSVRWNKLLRPFLRLVVYCSGAGDGLVRLGFVEFGDQVEAPDLGGSCVISSDPVSSSEVWRIFFCPSLFSIGAGIDVISPAASSGGMSYQPGKRIGL
jgi:hypothetical protein